MRTAAKFLLLRFPCLISLFLGATLVLAFAPINWYPFAFIAPAILYALLQRKSSQEAALIGWWFGVGQFGAGVSWIYVSIHVYGFTPIPIAVVFTGLFISVLAIFPLIQCYLLVRFFPKNSNSKLFLVYPLSWVLIEWIRSWIFTGFPWLLIAYSQVNDPLLKGFVPILGEFGVGALTIFISASLFYIVSNYKKCSKIMMSILSILLIAISGQVLFHINWTKPLGKPISVALIQGDISQSIKWDPNKVRSIVKTYYDLTIQHWHEKIIVWPEAAVPLPLNDAEKFLTPMDALAKQHHVSIITGIPVQVNDSFKYYNAMIGLGDGSGHYYKQHLVPFGEYVPMANLLRGFMRFFNLPMSDMIPGSTSQSDLKADNIVVDPFICYEIAYAQDLFRQASQSAVLLTISDDAWFGDSLAPAQHLQIGQFRALQSGRDLLFDGNNGITAIVNDKGKIINRIPQFVQGVLVGDFQPRTGKTPWLYIGNQPIILFMFIVLAILVWNERKKSCPS